MTGAMSRRKGAQWERDLVKIFREAMPGTDVKRGLQPRGGGEVPDVDCPMFWIEAKRGRKPNVRAALKQAINDCSDDRVPVAVIRDDREDAFVSMLLSDFIRLVEKVWKDKISLARSN